MDTCGDPYPFQVCMTRRRPRLFQIWDQSSMPNFACLDGRLNYDGSYKWWDQPIVQRQLIWRKLCGMWILRSYDRGMSGIEKKRKFRFKFLKSHLKDAKIFDFKKNKFTFPKGHKKKSGNWEFSNKIKISNIKYLCIRFHQIKLTHSWPYESVRSFTAFESHCLRIPNNVKGKNPFSAMMTKYTKKPAAAWIIPIWPYAIEISLFVFFRKKICFFAILDLILPFYANDKKYLCNESFSLFFFLYFLFFYSSKFCGLRDEFFFILYFYILTWVCLCVCVLFTTFVCNLTLIRINKNHPQILVQKKRETFKMFYFFCLLIF